MFRATARPVITTSSRRLFSGRVSQPQQYRWGLAVGAGLTFGAFASMNHAENSWWGNNSASTPPASAVVDYKKVKADIVAAIEAEDSKRGDGTSMAPTLIRLAWHAAGTYSIFDRTGGSSAASMRFSPECGW
jgi:hypothetical protein